MNIIHEIKEYLLSKMIDIPGECGYRLRYRYYQLKLKHCGINLVISKGVVISSPHTISIDNHCRINQDCHIRGEGGLHIGSHTMIAMNVIIITSSHNHELNGISFDRQGIKYKPINIGKNCWIGANTVILQGVDIGNNCVIAAGSIITRNIPNNTIVIQRHEHIQ